MFVSEILLALLTTVIFSIIWIFFKEVGTPFPITMIYGILLAVVWCGSILAPFVRYQRYRYRFSEEDIDVREGVLFIHRDIVPIERLHKVALESGPVDRIFGLSKVIVTTAGGDVTIRFLELSVAEQIVSRLKTRINQYAVEKREG